MAIPSVLEKLELTPLAGEGGLWAPIYRDGTSNAIYFAMVAPDFSAWHRIPEPEFWIHVAGSPVELFTVEGGALTRNVLNGESADFTYRVPAQTWMAARPIGEWSLVICTLTPPFSKMELLDKSDPMVKELDMPGLFHV